MASSDDNEDLERAIAMSLADGEPSQSPFIDLAGSPDEDEDLRRALALSLQDGERSSDDIGGRANNSVPRPESAPQNNSRSESTASHQPLQYAPSPTNRNPTTQPLLAQPATDIKASSLSFGLLGMDRKAMEQERLTRLGKRKRSKSPEIPSKMIEIRGGPMQDMMSSCESQSAVKESTAIQYPRGTVKRTWASFHPRANDIRIEEVLEARTLKIAVLSAFQWEDQWLVGQPDSNDPHTCNWLNGKLDPRKVKQIWVVGKKGEQAQSVWTQDVSDARIPQFKSIFAPMDGQIQSSHSKYMLLFHETHLRIVIPTANVVKTDWGETGKNSQGESWQPAVMENSVFLIDLPRRPDGQVSRQKDLTWFGKELVGFLDAQGVGKNVVEGVLKFDFCQTERLAFVHSIPGKYGEQFPDRTGLPGLATAIRRLGLGQVRTLELDYAASSLGAVSTDFLLRLRAAACGAQALTVDNPRAGLLDDIRIYFPSHDTVVNSTGGPRCGGIITLDRGHYGGRFAKQCMRDYKSTRPGLLSHNKMLLARGRKTNGEPFAWAYVGSANLSESAWGSQKMLKSGKEGKLVIRNWECGVVVPVAAEKLAGLQLTEGQAPPMSVFKGTVEVPFEYPGERYEGKEPWFYKEQGSSDG